MTHPQPDDREPDTQPRPVHRRSRGVLWIIAGLLAVIAVQLGLSRGGSGLTREALGQFQQRAGARGVYAFTGQLDKNTFGLFMLDVEAGTIWCYEFTGKPAADRRMKLAAARLWLYDRYLENFNIDGLTPDEVAELVEEQRRQKLGSGVGAAGPGKPGGGSPAGP